MTQVRSVDEAMTYVHKSDKLMMIRMKVRIPRHQQRFWDGLCRRVSAQMGVRVDRRRIGGLIARKYEVHLTGEGQRLWRWLRLYRQIDESRRI